MVNYYFGSKEQLFAEAMTLALTPSSVLGKVLEQSSTAPPVVKAERVLTAVITVWEQAANREPFVDLIRQAMSEEAVRLSMTDFLSAQVITLLAEHSGGRFASQHATAAMTVIAGMIFTRYVVRLEPMASLPPCDVVRLLAPMVAAHLR